MEPFQTPPAIPAQTPDASAGGGEAIAAIVFSALSITQIFVRIPIFTIFAMFCAIIGVVLGHIALARRVDTVYRTVAVIALAIGYFSVAIVFIRLLLFSLYVIHASNALFHPRRFLR